MPRALVILCLLTVPSWPASGPVREASSPAIVGRHLPAFYNGYLYSIEPHHILTLFAPDGHAMLTLVVPGHGNGDVWIESLAIDADGSLAISWIDPPNASIDDHAGIDIRDPLGNLIRTIDTGAYVAAHLSFDESHSLWSLGSQYTPNWREAQDYMIVRKYSPQGKEVGAYLPRSLFPRGLAPGMQRWQQRQITVTRERVGVEVNSGNIGNQREWVELDLNGNLTGRWRLDPSDQFPGVALTSDGQAYVHRYDREAKSQRVFRLDHPSSTWQLVDSPTGELYGADGDLLVFADWTDGIMHMSWLPQPAK